MKIGILEILALPSQSLWESIFYAVFAKQFASVTPQAISVWCKELGHETYYATYYGSGTHAHKLLPSDLDVVFISSTTQFSYMAYALAKIYKKKGTFTVIGGPHAKSYPEDCRRFFDLVVLSCNKELIKNIINRDFPPQTIISGKSFTEVPLVEERIEEIKSTSLFRKKWGGLINIVPMLTSTGCPYSCNFCIDWNTPYQVLSMDRLKADIDYISKNLPGMVMGFWEPNFAVKFDQVFDILESYPVHARIPYIMECSLSILNESRIKRLGETKCAFSLFGIESWSDEYSNKSGLGRKREGQEKLDGIVDKLHKVYGNSQYIQANFIFGLDSDQGDEPISLSKQFIKRTPVAWPVFNTLIPYGGTPLLDYYLSENRLLKKLPFCFYYTPYLVTVLKNYDPVSYYEKFMELSRAISDKELLKQRMKCAPTRRHKMVHWFRNAGEHILYKQYRHLRDMLLSDQEYRDFHEGKSEKLPEYYYHMYNKKLSIYAELLSREELEPVLVPTAELQGSVHVV